ncbi:MAG: DUF4296 domain-containing protein [Chitinophagales bacterium]
MKRLYQIYFLILLFISVFLIPACSNEAPIDTTSFDYTAPIERETMIDIMIDIHLAEALANNTKLKREGVELKAIGQYYEDIFEAHQIDQEKFTMAFEYYTQRPNDFDLMYEELIDRMSKMQAEVTAK